MTEFYQFFVFDRWVIGTIKEVLGKISSGDTLCLVQYEGTHEGLVYSSNMDLIQEGTY